MKALERRLKVIGLAPVALERAPRLRTSAPPSGTSVVGRSRITRPSSSGTPEHQHLGHERVRSGAAGSSRRPRRGCPRAPRASSWLICADERFSPISGPKSTSSFQAGLRASGNSSTATTRPTRMSTLRKSSKLDHGAAAYPARARRALGGRLAPRRAPAGARPWERRSGLARGLAPAAAGSGSSVVSSTGVVAGARAWALASRRPAGPAARHLAVARRQRHRRSRPPGPARAAGARHRRDRRGRARRARWRAPLARAGSSLAGLTGSSACRLGRLVGLLGPVPRARRTRGATAGCARRLRRRGRRAVRSRASPRRRRR